MPNRPPTSTACSRTLTKPTTPTPPRFHIPAARSCRRHWRWASAKNPEARNCCAPLHWVTTSAHGSTCRCTPMISARPATRRTASAPASAPPLQPRCWQASTTTACAMRCRTPHSSVRAFRAGCAMKNISKRRSTSAACRRATALPRHRWSLQALPRLKTCSRASATSSSPMTKPAASARHRSRSA